jgi:uncharacterized membrane protein
MLSRVRLGGQAVHPFLVKFPIGLYTAGFVALWVFVATRETFWFHASFVGLLAGAAMAVIAAPIGLIDASGLHRDSRARSIAVYHGGAAVLSTFLFGGAGWSMLSQWRHAPAVTFDLRLPIAFSLVGFGLLVTTGLLSSFMVYKHHAAVSPIPGVTARVKLPQPLHHGGHV